MTHPVYVKRPLEFQLMHCYVRGRFLTFPHVFAGGWMSGSCRLFDDRKEPTCESQGGFRRCWVCADHNALRHRVTRREILEHEHTIIFFRSEIGIRPSRVVCEHPNPISFWGVAFVTVVFPCSLFCILCKSGYLHVIIDICSWHWVKVCRWCASGWRPE